MRALRCLSSIISIRTEYALNNYFTAILWNTSYNLASEIVPLIPNIEKCVTLNIADISDFIYHVYKLDKRCSHSIVLPPKIDRLSAESSRDFYLIKFKIDNPTFTHGVCNEAVALKEHIRKNFRHRIPNYIRDLVIHVSDDFETSNYIWNRYGDSPQTHREVYDSFLNLLNSNGVDFIIMRGFKYLPLRADTDLDTVIHPSSSNAFESVCNSLTSKGVLRASKSKQFCSPSKSSLYYTPVFTKGTEGQNLPGGYYRFDTYSDLFFYKDGEGASNNAVLPSPLFKKYLFDNKVKVDNYYIPNTYSEIILLIYRCLYDKRGHWSEKHTSRINYLISSEDFCKDEFDKVCKFEFSQNIYENLTNKTYHLITKADQKFTLFLIRKGGMEKEIVSDILYRITKQGYDILDLFLTTVRDEKKMYSSLYDNFNQFEKEITKENSNQCVCVVTNSLPDVDISYFKNSVRQDYVDVFPNHGGLPGNLLHASDSPEDALRELEVLLDPSITSFTQLGTYYSQRLT